MNKKLTTLIGATLAVCAYSSNAAITIDDTLFTTSVSKNATSTVLTFDTTGFSATSSDKLVIGFGGRPVLAEFPNVPNLVSATYGGIDLQIGEYHQSGQTISSVFYLDNVASDGNIVFTFSSGWGDSLGINLFALTGTADGGPTATDSMTGAGAALSLDAPGDGGFMLYQTGLRGGGTASITDGTDPGVLTLTNSRGTAAYFNGTTSGATYSGSQTGSSNGFDSSVMAYFAPIPEPSTALLGGFGMLLMLRRRRQG